MPNDGTVHIIDDDVAVRQSLAFLLATAGTHVRLYASAAEFLAGLDQAAPGCVVTDVRMPDIDGLELLSRLKQQGSSLPVIVMTGHADVPLAVQAMKQGAVDFIEKPFDDDRFIRAVRTSLARAAGEEATQGTIRADLASLSERERQVLEGVLGGKANKIIAHELGLSPRTVEVYRANMMAKMRADSLADLVRKAMLVRIA